MDQSLRQDKLVNALLPVTKPMSLMDIFIFVEKEPDDYYETVSGITLSDFETGKASKIFGGGIDVQSHG